MRAFELIKEHQLDIMLFLSGICAIMAVLTLISRSLPAKRRRVLALLEFEALLLLIFDRLAYIFRGDVSTAGFFMVRISNFMVFLLTLLVLHSITLFLFDLLRSRKIEKTPKRLCVCEALFTAGVILLVISQFTGLYYTFDEQNLYHRSALNFISYVAPLLITFLQVSVVIQYRKTLGEKLVWPMLLNAFVPILAAVVQVFVYGLSLANVTVVGTVVVFHIFALSALNDEVRRARNLEVKFYKEEKQREHDLFEQTVRALVSAIDEKDAYTNGHSHRVAEYSRAIAEAAGKSEEYCEEVFFAALLHDVGKIGISDAIINKRDELTPEENEIVKKHPEMGARILEGIGQSPCLAEGAKYHHERYDGMGYPEGLKGDEIPEAARIIAVADAYDAMASKRSYRDTLPQAKVREEIVKGRGKQFDPVFADIMVGLIDGDKDYSMRD